MCSTLRCRNIRSVKKSGFTLVELLVVISIIAILIALLLPALAKAKSLANSVACKANLHSMGVAMEEYESTYQNFLPNNATTGAFRRGRSSAASLHRYWDS